MIIGHGVDILDLDRIRKILSFAEDDFLLGTFTKRERELFYPSYDKAEFFGGRLAAKEAVAKALGTGLGFEVSWQHIEIDRNESGGPILLLNGPAKERSDLLQIRFWSLSISHSPLTAMASAIAET